MAAAAMAGVVVRRLVAAAAAAARVVAARTFPEVVAFHIAVASAAVFAYHRPAGRRQVVAFRSHPAKEADGP